MENERIRALFEFIEQSPTAFHAAETMRQKLLAAGYTQLRESEAWQLQPGGRYFLLRGGSALIAFRIPSVPPLSFQIIAGHDDSPFLKIKENPELEAEGHYVRLNVERYGGMLCAPWFDRPLSVAGRLILRTEDGIRTRLVDAKAPLLLLPSLAIHMNREANDGQKYSIQKDMLPLFGDENAKGSFLARMAALAGASEADLLGHDLFVYNCMPGTVWGADGEYMSIGRLDDMECVFASLTAFLESEQAEGKETGSVPVHCVFDHEEVGSGTCQGAGSTFLADTLQRICEGLGLAPSDYRRLVAQSFLLSADNAHAVHPNHGEKACPGNRPYMNRGIVIKHSANQKYTTDGVSAALFREICAHAGVPCQDFLNHSDLPGGSTLGCISVQQVPIRSVDIGLAQLAMHSPYETAGTADPDYLIRAARCFYRCAIRTEADGSCRILF